MPVAERIVVGAASTIKLVPACKPLASSGVCLAEVSMVAAGKMTSASVASQVSTAMTAAAVTTGMTATAMAATTVAATTFAPGNVGRQSQRPERKQLLPRSGVMSALCQKRTLGRRSVDQLICH